MCKTALGGNCGKIQLKWTRNTQKQKQKQKRKQQQKEQWFVLSNSWPNSLTSGWHFRKWPRNVQCAEFACHQSKCACVCVCVWVRQWSASTRKCVASTSGSKFVTNFCLASFGNHFQHFVVVVALARVKYLRLVP